MTRAYTQTRRAEKHAETRRRIVESALALHAAIGPAQTSLSGVAQKAGVQRNTLYAHFPDERSLLTASLALSLERGAPPDGAAWRPIAHRSERLRAGLKAVYGWYAASTDLIGRTLRDAEQDPLVREVSAAAWGRAFATWRVVLGEGLSGPQMRCCTWRWGSTPGARWSSRRA